MKLDKNTYGTVMLVYLVCIIAVALLLLVPVWWVKWPLVAIVIWIAIWQTYFHMVPDREPVGSDRLVSAVSDGKVIHVEKAFEPVHLKREAIMISVYMDFWDVHANFWPVTGTVSFARYFPGKHMLAFKPKASEENEHSCTVIRTPAGSEVMFKQLAGGFARRIVCYAKDGLDVRAGEQCGIIKFGSRIDYFLPLDANVRVKPGDFVKAVSSIIAEL